MTAHVHKLLRETAQSMCHALYDTLMHKNEWYDEWKRQNPGLGAKALEARFVAKNWGTLVEGARATLAGMLGMPYPEALKEQIYEALLLDRTLRRGRQHTGVQPLTKFLQ